MLTYCRTIVLLCRGNTPGCWNNVPVRYKARALPRRKPWWAPVAKTKKFFLPEVKQLPEDQTQQIVSLYRVYKTEMRSISSFLVEDHLKKQQTIPEDVSSNVEGSLDEDVELKDRLTWNATENKRVAALREERKIKERQEVEEYMMKLQMKAEEEQAKIMQNVEMMVKTEKELSSSFVRVDNLEEAIEYALTHPTTYDYAIDLDGNSYPASTPPAWPPSLRSSNSLIEQSYFQKLYPELIKASEDESFRNSGEN